MSLLGPMDDAHSTDEEHDLPALISDRMPQAGKDWNVLVMRSKRKQADE